MSRITELSGSNDNALVNRILRKVNQSLDEHFFKEQTKPVPRTLFGGEAEETLITRLPQKSSDKLSLPPPVPPPAQTPGPRQSLQPNQRANQELPQVPGGGIKEPYSNDVMFSKNDSPTHSSFAISTHPKSDELSGTKNTRADDRSLKGNSKHSIFTVQPPQSVLSASNISEALPGSELDIYKARTRRRYLSILLFMAIGASIVYFFWPLIAEYLVFLK